MQTLQVVVLAAHLLAANLAGAAPVVCLWLDLRESRRGDALAGSLGRNLLRQALIWLTVALTLGGLLLLVVWRTAWEPFYAAAERIPASRFWWGAAELAFYYVCTGGYLALWRRADHPQTWRLATRRTLGLLAGTNLLYHFPLLFTVIGVYGARGADAAATLDFRRALIDPEVLSQFLHHLVAAFAVAGIAMIGYALSIRRAGAAEDDVRRAAAWGGRLALAPTIVQLLVGLYVLAELPTRARDELLGGDMVASAFFGASLVGAIALLHRLAAVAFGEADRRSLLTAIALMLFVVLSMVAARTRMRRDRLASLNPPPAATVKCVSQRPIFDHSANDDYTPRRCGFRKQKPCEADAIPQNLDLLALSHEDAHGRIDHPARRHDRSDGENIAVARFQLL